jgi:hypothetical protein
LYIHSIPCDEVPQVQDSSTFYVRIFLYRYYAQDESLCGDRSIETINKYCELYNMSNVKIIIIRYIITLEMFYPLERFHKVPVTRIDNKL